MSKKVLIVTSCTGAKRHKPENQLVLADFQHPEHLSQRTSELSNCAEMALNMYTGRQHTELVKGLNHYRSRGGQVSVVILSAGYGLIDEQTRIVPYEVTFNTMGNRKLKEWSKQISITQDFITMTQGYDIILLLLGECYLQAIDWTQVEMAEHQKFIFFASRSSKSRILRNVNTYMLEIGTEEASYFHSGLIAIKGTLSAKLLEAFSLDPTLSWESIYEHPERIRTAIVDAYHSQTNNQITLFADEPEQPDTSHLLSFHKYVAPYDIPPELVAKNYKTELRFFMPENDDRVDPQFQFETNYSDPKRDVLTDDWYAHEFYGTPQYDGILISKTNIDVATKRKQTLIEQQGIRAFLRLPADAVIMGDCGAFSYIGKEMPPYTTEQVLDYYEGLGFDYGVSVDHLIVGQIEKDPVERERRYQITIQNAQDFIERHRVGNYCFTPVGVAQGFDTASFREAVQALIQMGYQHIALGGLAREKSNKILAILKAISPIIPDRMFRMHLFGVAREETIMRAFHMLGVTSFDSASPLRRAWLGAGHNYHTPTKHYAAIRIPEASEKKGRVKQQLQASGVDFAQFKRLEEHALWALRQFDRGELGVEEALQAILAYDQLLGDGRATHEALYRKVLQDKPWQACGCEVCRKIGIDVVIFRGNNRNRRRGFHNTYVYYQQLREMRERLFMGECIERLHPV